MKKLILTIITIGSLHLAHAQKIKWDTGNLKVLKGQTSLSTEVIYENLKISDMNEKDFLDEKRKKLNDKKAGTGDTYCTKWEEAKTTKYITKLNEYIGKSSKNKVSASTENANAKYKLILKPNNINVGKGNALGSKPALVDFDITIVDNANPSSIVAHGIAKKVKGEAKKPKGSAWAPAGVTAAMDISNAVQNMDATNRISESFELLANAIGKAMK